ncbi:MAG: hypothetical protein IPN34_17985 [Planctomycetes bacterium]|nr:hypothetical protein [Planctomycetota bacterium]
MGIRTISPINAAVALVATAALLFPQQPAAPQPNVRSHHALREASRPLFVKNCGQWDQAVLWAARSGNTWITLERDGWSLILGATLPHEGRAVLRVHFALRGAREALRAEPEGAGCGSRAFFRGSDPARWVTDLAAYRSVCLKGDGFAVRFREKAGSFAYDLLLDEGATLRELAIEVQGHAGLHLDQDRSLVLETALGVIRQPAPLAWCGETACELLHDARFRLLDANHFALDLAAADELRDLVLDPELRTSTSFGGPTGEIAWDVIAVGSSRLWVCGETADLEFPSTTGGLFALPPRMGTSFVCLIDLALPPEQQLVYSALIGGSEAQVALCLADAGTNAVFVGGRHSSRDFPTTPGAYSRQLTGDSGSWIAKLDLSARGAGQLAWCTLFGGINGDLLQELVPCGDGAVGGIIFCYSADFPTTPGAFLSDTSGRRGSALFELDPRASGSAQLRYATRFHGNEPDAAWSLARDGEQWVIAGTARSLDLPVTANAFAALPSPLRRYDHYDGFLAVLDPRLTGRAQLVYGTYLAGSGDDQIRSVRVLEPGIYAFVGGSDSQDFPITARTLPASPRGSYEAIVGILDTHRAPSAQLRYGALFGGEGSDVAVDLELDPSGALVLIGSTTSQHLPTTEDAQQPRAHSFGFNQPEQFFARIDPARSPEKQLIHSTYHGGDGSDLVNGGALAPPLLAISVGTTWSSDFPETPRALGSVHPGDATLVALDLLPRGLTSIGTPTSSCARQASLGANSEPRIGVRDFELWCGGAPGSALGGLLFATDVLASPLAIGPLALHLDPWRALAIPVQSDTNGRARWILSIPRQASLVGTTLALQCLWSEPHDAGACVANELSASNALRVAFAH